MTPYTQSPSNQAEEAEISANEQRLSLLRAQRLDEHRRWAKNEKAIVARWLVIMRQAKSEELRKYVLGLSQIQTLFAAPFVTI
jgi:hypothetical protein|tara:strand:+ start:13152 stop:13400 length:249 start_codon:yes stop_codon:yes gene_type:complete